MVLNKRLEDFYGFINGFHQRQGTHCRWCVHVILDHREEPQKKKLFQRSQPLIQYYSRVFWTCFTSHSWRHNTVRVIEDILLNFFTVAYNPLIVHAVEDIQMWSRVRKFGIYSLQILWYFDKFSLISKFSIYQQNFYSFLSFGTGFHCFY